MLHGFDVFLGLVPLHHDLVAAAHAPQAEICAGAEALPFFLAAGVGLFHGDDVANANVHADTYTQEREQGYLYPHDFPNHWVRQQYLPDDIKHVRYYEYGPNKLEQTARSYWDQIKGGK